jgi:YegS/Rv2252/BmrU family lipid kinase
VGLPVLIIVNPKAGTFKQGRLDTAVRMFKAAGYGVDTYFTGKTGDAEARTKEAVNEAYAMIVSGGGDGTINEVANGAAFSGTPVAVLPFGTSSVLCKDLGIKDDIGGAVKKILNGTLNDVSLGRIRTMPPGAGRTRYFVEMAGVGFDAEAVFGVNKRFKAYAGVGAYILSGIKCLANLKSGNINLTVDGDFITCNTVIISNGTRYGGDINLAPGADIRNPMLYATFFRYSGRLGLLAVVAKVLLGRHVLVQSRYVEQIEFRRMVIEGSGFHVHVDGDYYLGGKTPVEVDSVERALKLVY